MNENDHCASHVAQKDEREALIGALRSLACDPFRLIQNDDVKLTMAVENMLRADASLHAQLSEARATIEALQYLLTRFYDFVARAPVSSGVCCCGDSVEGHAATDHSPIDMWDYSIGRVWKKVIDAALAHSTPAPVNEEKGE